MATRSKRNVLCPTCIRDSGPLKPGTVSPSTNLSCEIRMCTAAAVVNPDISVSDRYMTINPTCSSPIPSWKQIERRYALVWLKTIVVFKFYNERMVDVPGIDPLGKWGRQTLRLSAHLSSGPQKQWCWQADPHRAPGGSLRPPPWDSVQGKILVWRTTLMVSRFTIYHMLW